MKTLYIREDFLGKSNIPNWQPKKLQLDFSDMQQEEMEQIIHRFNHRCKIAMFVAVLFCPVGRYVNLFLQFRGCQPRMCAGMNTKSTIWRTN